MMAPIMRWCSGQGFALRIRGALAGNHPGSRWNLACPALPLQLVVGRLKVLNSDLTSFKCELMEKQTA